VNQSGISTYDIAFRQPLYQHVSDDDSYEETFGVRLLGGIPSNSDVGKDGKVEFDVWGLFRVGEHVSIQASVGVNEFVGPDNGGNASVPWALVGGYRLERTQLNIPYVSETWLMAEIEGDGQMASNSTGSPIFGVVGGWLDFNAVSHYQPRLGVGLSFPLDGAASNQQDWGVVVNFLVSY
jgi:hypothetical protein